MKIQDLEWWVWSQVLSCTYWEGQYLPCCPPAHTRHFSDTSREDATKCACKCRSGEEKCHAEAAFISNIPARR